MLAVHRAQFLDHTVLVVVNAMGNGAACHCEGCSDEARKWTGRFAVIARPLGRSNLPREIASAKRPRN
ncbi:MAG TPA: hypothetical protein VGG99_26640, partial [Acetobacteraceae bacterium]